MLTQSAIEYLHGYYSEITVKPDIYLYEYLDYVALSGRAVDKDIIIFDGIFEDSRSDRYYYDFDVKGYQNYLANTYVRNNEIVKAKTAIKNAKTDGEKSQIHIPLPLPPFNKYFESDLKKHINNLDSIVCFDLILQPREVIESGLYNEISELYKDYKCLN